MSFCLYKATTCKSVKEQINKNYSKKNSKQYCYSGKSFKFAISTNSEGSV